MGGGFERRPMQKRQWKNVPGRVSAEIIRDDYWYDTGRITKVFPPSVSAELDAIIPQPWDAAEPELVIDFLSSGWYDPGKTTGPPERCYPPEGGDERLLDGAVTVTFDRNRQKRYLSKSSSEALFDLYEDEIAAANIGGEETDGTVS